MATCIALIDRTDRGVKNFKDSVSRYETAEKRTRTMGVEFTNIYWTLGAHDIVSVVDGLGEVRRSSGTLALCQRRVS
jgi:uncharacterized protein with GYD domain